MGQRTLSIFIDESGDFGKYNPRSPYYYVAMVFHDQSLDISEKVQGLDEHVRHLGFPDHAIHAGPLVRREKQYSQDTMERRQALFKTLFHFLRSLDVRYVCPKVNKMECDDSKEAFIAKLSRVISDELKKHSDYLCSFDLIINYYDYGQSELTKILISIFSALFSDVEFRKVRPADYKLFQVADLICTMELTNDKAERNALSKSEREFFHSARDFRKNLYKQLLKKRL